MEKDYKKKITTLAEIDMEIKKLNIKGIGKNKKQDEELYTVLRVLQVDCEALGVTYPFFVEISDKPDTILSTNNFDIGIEVTFALNQTLQKARKIRDGIDPKLDMEPSLYKVHNDRSYIEQTLEKSNRVFLELKKLQWSSTIVNLTLRDFKYQYNEFCKINNKQLSASACVDNELEKYVADLVINSIESKIEKFRKYEIYSKNYLVIYSDELWVDNEIVVAMVKNLLLLEMILFDKIILRIQDKNYILFTN